MTIFLYPDVVGRRSDLENYIIFDRDPTFQGIIYQHKSNINTRQISIIIKYIFHIHV